MKKIAILMSTYCGEVYLSDLLRSLVSQSVKEFTLFIRDDGSSDSTILIVQSFFEHLDIVLIAENFRLGPAKSFMKLLESVPDSYSYFFFADQDDYWHPHKIERAVSMLSSHDNQPSLYCSRLELVDADLNHLSYSGIPHLFELSNALVENIVTGCTIAINSQARRVLLRSLPEYYVMHDWWIYIVISAFGSVFYDEFPSIKYRQHNNNFLGMEVGFYKKYYDKIALFFNDANKYNSSIYAQAVCFKKCFSESLSRDHLSLVDGLIEAKEFFFKRLRLVLFSRYRRQTLFSSLVLRFRFLLNKY